MSILVDHLFRCLCRFSESAPRHQWFDSHDQFLQTKFLWPYWNACLISVCFWVSLFRSLCRHISCAFICSQNPYSVLVSPWLPRKNEYLWRSIFWWHLHRRDESSNFEGCAGPAQVKGFVPVHHSRVKALQKNRFASANTDLECTSCKPRIEFAHVIWQGVVDLFLWENQSFHWSMVA